MQGLKAASIPEISAFFLVLNGVIFVSSVAFCWTLGRIFHRKRIFDRWEPLRPVELAAAFGSIVLNAGISVVGWALWRDGWIRIRQPEILHGILDCLLMILAMDLGMYFLHRLAHVPSVYRLFHNFHHRHETTNPISLFVLHPLEILGFGGLMIVVLMILPISLGGLIGFLTLNVLFGTLGHSGVEPFPSALKSVPLLRLVGTSTFHAEHHEHPRYNFGFYTLIWDKLFGTLDPAYEARFSRDVR
ncbi:MAG: sterol desaturase family protein [Luteolibacter sp.]